MELPKGKKYKVLKLNKAASPKVKNLTPIRRVKPNSSLDFYSSPLGLPKRQVPIKLKPIQLPTLRIEPT